MLFRIIKLMICAWLMFLWSCDGGGGCEFPVEPDNNLEVVYVNESSHIIEIEWVNDRNRMHTIAVGTSFRAFSIHCSNPEESFVTIPGYFLYFDNEVIYKGKDDDESDYPHLLSNRDSYVFHYEYPTETSSKGVWTYTFTDADYDYAVEHSEK